MPFHYVFQLYDCSVNADIPIQILFYYSLEYVKLLKYKDYVYFEQNKKCPNL